MYNELLNFKLKATNILENRAYEISNERKVPVFMNCLVLEGLLLIQTFTQEEKEKCKMTKALFLVLSSKFKPCHNQIIISLQYQKM